MGEEEEKKEEEPKQNGDATEVEEEPQKNGDAPEEEMSLEPKEEADSKEMPKPDEYETIKIKKFKCQIFLNDQVQHTSVKNTEQEVINYCKIGFLNKNKVKVMSSCEKGFTPPKTKKDKDLIFNLKEEN